MLKALTSLAALAAWFLVAGVSGNAAGTFMIRHANGTVNTYDRVTVKILHSALYITSQDGKGTVVIHRAACSYQGKLLVCFPTSATLIQGGKTEALDLKSGTIYLNDTDDAQPLVLSTAKVPAHSILLSFTTKRGSYVSLNGRIDQVVK